YRDMAGQLGKLTETDRLKLAQQATGLHEPLRAIGFQALAQAKVAPRFYPQDWLIVQPRALRDAIERQQHAMLGAQRARFVHIGSLLGHQARASNALVRIELIERAGHGATYALAKGLP